MKSAEQGSNPFSQKAFALERKLKEKGECRDQWGDCGDEHPHRCAGKPIGHGNQHKCGCGSTRRLKKRGDRG